MNLQLFFNSLVDFSASENLSVLLYSALTCVVCKLFQKLSKAKISLKNVCEKFLPFAVGLIFAAADAFFGTKNFDVGLIFRIVADGFTIGAISATVSRFGVGSQNSDAAGDNTVAFDEVFSQVLSICNVRRCLNELSPDEIADKLKNLCSVVAQVCRSDSDLQAKTDLLRSLLADVADERDIDACVKTLADILKQQSK